MYRKQALICITITNYVTGEPKRKKKKYNLGDQMQGFLLLLQKLLKCN